MRQTMRLFFGSGDEARFMESLESARQDFLHGGLLGYNIQIGGSGFIALYADYDDADEAGWRAADKLRKRGLRSAPENCGAHDYAND